LFTSDNKNINNYKWIAISAKILSSTTVFNIDNTKKYFLSSKSSYYNDF